MTDYFKSVNFSFTGLPSLFSSGPQPQLNGLKNLAKSDLLQIGNHLTGILADKKVALEPPQLVVVGTQSSGKSSLLNRVLEMDVLPMGKNMVTRCPMNLQLVNSPLNVAEFGDYIDGVWKPSKKIEMTPGTNYAEAISLEIEEQTKQKAGAGQNISHNAIVLKIYSPNYPTISLVDLPGLTSVACLDKGQPADIKDQIRRLVGSYIKSERSIILLVMAARSDLEVDQGLELAKEYDPHGLRTVGVITKVDLMNSGTDVGDYLENRNISESLQMKYGYFAVKNKGPDQKDQTMTPSQVTEQEQAYFKTHSTYSQMKRQDRLGVPNLTNHLTEILSEHIRLTLPAILSEVYQIEMGIDKALKELGSLVPEKEADMTSLAHMLMSNFCRTFASSIKDRGVALNYGRQLKDIFVEYRQAISKLAYTVSNERIQEALRNCDGNHMTSLPSIEILEYCLKASQSHESPMAMFRQPSVACLEKVTALLTRLVEDVSKEAQISRFANLTNAVKRELTTNIFNRCHQKCLEQIQNLIRIEENYIWTDDMSFQAELGKLYQNLKPNAIDYNAIRSLINGYFDVAKRNIGDRFPKELMLHYLKTVEDEVCESLFDKLTKAQQIGKLLEESPQIADRRRKLTEQKKQLVAIRTLIETCQ